MTPERGHVLIPAHTRGSLRPVRLMGATFRRRRRLVAVAIVCLAAAAAGLGAIAARGGSISCIPVATPHETGQRTIAEVFAASGGKVYVRTTGSQLVAVDGVPVGWRKGHFLAPGRLLDALPGHGHEVIYAGDDALYRSGNGGQSWERLGCGHVLDGVAVAARQPNLIYLAADVLDGPPQGVGGGLYRTRDGGRTWSHLSVFPREDATVQAVAINPRSTNDVTVALADGGVARSLDGGHHWSFSTMGFKLTGPSGAGLRGPQVWNLAYGAAPAHTLWAGSQQGVFRRGRNGMWTKVLRSGYAADLTVVPDARLPRLAFAVGGPAPKVARRTVDGGKTWRPLPGLPTDIQGISIRQSDDTVYAWTSHRIYQSSDHGTTWTRLPRLPRR